MLFSWWWLMGMLGTSQGQPLMFDWWTAALPLFFERSCHWLHLKNLDCMPFSQSMTSHLKMSNLPLLYSGLYIYMCVCMYIYIYICTRNRCRSPVTKMGGWGWVWRRDYNVPCTSRTSLSRRDRIKKQVSALLYLHVLSSPFQRGSRLTVSVRHRVAFFVALKMNPWSGRPSKAKAAQERVLALVCRTFCRVALLVKT